MKTQSVNLASHYAGEVTTIAKIYKVTRKDSEVFGFTSADIDLVIDGLTYEASTGGTISAIASNASLAVDNLEFAGFLDSASLTEEDIIAGIWDDAEIITSEVNYKSVADGVMILSVGHVGNINTGRITYSTELRGLVQKLQQTIGEAYTAGCPADLGDARCGVNLASFTVTGSVTGTSSRSIFADTSRTEASGYFDYGKITWTSGLNIGLSKEVKQYTSSGDIIALQEAMPYDIAIGDTYSMHAGCDKAFSTCGTKFSNVVNFRGFPHVPGTDRLYSGT